MPFFRNRAEMEDEGEITVKIPFLKRLKAWQILILAIFFIFMLFLTNLLKFTLTEAIENPNLVIAIVISVLCLIGIVVIFLIRTLIKEKESV